MTEQLFEVDKKVMSESQGMYTATDPLAGLNEFLEKKSKQVEDAFSYKKTTGGATAVEVAKYLSESGKLEIPTLHDTKDWALHFINANDIDKPKRYIDNNKIPAIGTGIDADFVVVVPTANITKDISVKGNPSQMLVYTWDASSNLEANLYGATREANSAGYGKLCSELKTLCAEEGIQIVDGDETDLLAAIEADHVSVPQHVLDRQLSKCGPITYEVDKANDHHGIYNGQTLTGYTDTKVYTNKDVSIPTATVVHPREAFALDDAELAEKVGNKVDITYKEGKAKLVETKEKDVNKAKGREV